MLTSHKVKNRNTPRIRPVISVYNTCLPLVERCAEVGGGGRVYAHTRPAHENHKRTSYSWRMTVEQMRELLPLMLPWLIAKRPQAELLIEALERKALLTPAAGVDWRPDDSDIQRITEIQAQISALNRKGRHMTNVVSQEL